jgi:hypothetical protein
MSSFPCRPRTEAQRHDLAFYEGESNDLVAVAEMKVLYGPRDPRVRDVQMDLAKLRGATAPGVMLTMVGLPKESTEEHLQWLAHEIGISRQDFVTFVFDTLPIPPIPVPSIS